MFDRPLWSLTLISLLELSAPISHIKYIANINSSCILTETCTTKESLQLDHPDFAFKTSEAPKFVTCFFFRKQTCSSPRHLICLPGGTTCNVALLYMKSCQQFFGGQRGEGGRVVLFSQLFFFLRCILSNRYGRQCNYMRDNCFITLLWILLQGELGEEVEGKAWQFAFPFHSPSPSKKDGKTRGACAWRVQITFS